MHLLKPHRFAVCTILVVSVILCATGWKLFWFLTDDAYIAFRYISNRHMGWGYTWNPPPFLPVEGYTSFLWILLLDGVWTVLNVEPPDAANFVSLAFSVISLFINAAMLITVCNQRGKERTLPVFLGLVMIGIVVNRTFLMWTSSGLETALFNCLIHAWLLAALLMRNYPRGSVLWLTTTSGLLALTRPDGLLFILASLVMAALIILEPTTPKSSKTAWALRLIPVLVVPAHLIWRRFTYGEWLPNTYYAKSVSPWPESGVRYISSFVLEYALWIWIIVFGAAIAVRSASFLRTFKQKLPVSEEKGTQRLAFLASGLLSDAALVVAFLTICFHVGYYTFIIGGDHFEYRVYSYLIPIIMVSFIWAIFELRLKVRNAIILFLLFILAGLPIPWVHWHLSQDKTTRPETWLMAIPVSEKFPLPFSYYTGLFDSWQEWLILHSVCIRHQEHKVFAKHLLRVLPSRKKGGTYFKDEKNPVIAVPSAGIIGWVFSRVIIIDTVGLNDYVTARMPLREGQERMMAHDRSPPLGYVESFAPNMALTADGSVLRKYPRLNPLTDEKIRVSETYYRNLVKKHGRKADR